MTATPPETRRLSLQDATELAVADFQRGEHRAAVYLCDKILLQAPQAAVIWQIKGLSLLRLGEDLAGLDCLRQAVRFAPKDVEIAANAIESFRQFGDLETALSIGKKAVTLPSKTPTFLGNLGIAFFENGDLEEAKALHLQALKIAPNHIASLNNLGSIARDQKDPELALSFYQKALAKEPGYQEGHANLATLLIEIDRLDDAQAALATLFSFNPNHAEGLRCQSRIHLARNALDAAERSIQRAIKHSPDEMRNYTIYSQILFEKNQPDLALQAAQKALECDAGSEISLHQMGVVQSTTATAQDAMAWYRKALEVKPDFAPSLLGIAQLFLELGEPEQARTHFEKARALDEADTAPLIGLCRIRKVTSEENAAFKALEAMLPAAETMSIAKQISYRFALGDCYDGLKRYDAAFEQYDIATRLKRSTIDYDADLYETIIDRVIETFTPEFVSSLRQHANNSARPLFVVGMPRSGTTMTESILASHSSVAAAGELNDLQALFGFEAQDAQVEFAANLGHMSQEGIQARLTDYLAKLASVNTETQHVTDKMPSNFHMVGLIHALFPNARIIHTRRNAMDTCLSCFTRHFDRSQHQSYSLQEQGRFYLGYTRLMRHWRTVLPAQAFLDLDYEAIVTDPEPHIRSMLDFCGLEWEDACLNFHTSKRRVRTASITQVREPVYTSSVEKWRNYEQHLRPLSELLRDV